METRPAPSVYRPNQKFADAAQMRMKEHPRSSGAIQPMHGIKYTSIGLTYTPKEIARAGGPTPAHDSGSAGDGINANTDLKNSQLVDRLQANRAADENERKEGIAAAHAEKKAGKRPKTSTLKKGVASIFEEHGFPGGMAPAVRYLCRQGLEEGEAWELAESWAPIE